MTPSQIAGLGEIEWLAEYIKIYEMQDKKISPESRTRAANIMNKLLPHGFRVKGIEDGKVTFYRVAPTHHIEPREYRPATGEALEANLAQVCSYVCDMASRRIFDRNQADVYMAELINEARAGRMDTYEAIKEELRALYRSAPKNGVTVIPEGLIGEMGSVGDMELNFEKEMGR